MLPPKGRDRRRQLRVGPQIQQQNVGLRRVRVRQFPQSFAVMLVARIPRERRSSSIA
jgi:hypothetical protein